MLNNRQLRSLQNPNSYSRKAFGQPGARLNAENCVTVLSQLLRAQNGAANCFAEKRARVSFCLKLSFFLYMYLYNISFSFVR